MFQTRITQMLGIAYPLVGGAMMWISTPEFIASVSNAGGLGILASAMYPTRKQLESAIERTLDLREEILTVVAGEKARLMYENGDLDGGIISCGQGIGLVHDIPTVKELFEKIIGGASEIVKGFQDRAKE